MSDDDRGKKAGQGRGVSLVATAARWAALAALLAVAIVGAAEAYVSLSRAGRTLASLAGVLAAAGAVSVTLLWALLGAEERRLGRELRTARAGTSALRAMVVRRRPSALPFARLLSSKLGIAAVLLADGDRSGAVEALAGGSPLMQGGRLDRLRAVVDEDLARATGTTAALQRCIERLRKFSPIGNREADLYRTHVLVKALLEEGDVETGLAVARGLAASSDEDERVYATWLRTWFELDGPAAVSVGPWPPLSEGDLRRAALLARAHGADKLVERLDERVATIAPPVQGQ
jgi:hypothetical protein